MHNPAARLTRQFAPQVWIRRLAPYLVVLFAFAFRLYAADTTWVDKDRANPHAIGLIILDTLTAGRVSELPLFGDPATIRLPNPPLSSYFWALIAVFDRSLYAANAVGLMLNVLAVAITQRIARKLFNWETALIAATLMAASNWGVYAARGSWHPSQLEIGATICVYFLAMGAKLGDRWSLVRGFAAVALSAGTSLEAFGFFAQSFAATLAAGAAGRMLRRAWLIGMGLCAMSLFLYGLALALDGQIARLVDNELVAPSALSTAEELAGRDVTPFTRETIPHFFRMATNADYGITWTNPAIGLHAIRVPLEQAQAAIVSLAVLVGILALVRGGRMPANRFLLIWALAPIAAFMTIVALKPYFRVPPYYLLVTSPIVYLCGGTGFALALRRLRAMPLATASLCAALMIVPAWNFYAAAETVYTQPYLGTPTFIPLRWAQRLGAVLRTQCRTVSGDGGSLEWWAISLAERPDIRRDEGARFNEFSSAWSTEPGGGACAFKPAGPPMPNAEFLRVPLENGSNLGVYRALPYSSGNAGTTAVNLGWTLMDFDAPMRASAGTTLTVRHVWRIDALPSEPYGGWYFAPFIKLVSPDGRVVMDVDRAVSILGWGWRKGELILSDVIISLPKDLSAGEYTLNSSLFDPNQKKNAVYFDAAAPSVPILNLKRSIVIGP